MRHLLFTSLVTCFLLPLGAQSIPIDFTGDPGKPVVVENPATGKTLFFFYPDRLSSEAFARGGNPWKACEVDSKTLQVLRTSAGSSLRVANGNDLKFRVICRVSFGDEYYIAMENNKKCALYRFSGQRLDMSVADSFKVGKGMRIIGGVTNAGGGYILCTRKVRREGHQMVVYEIGEGGRLQEHRFRVDVRRNYLIEQAFKRDFKPLSVEYEMEMDPKPASTPVKMFAGNRKLFLTFDDANVGSVYTNTTAILRVMTLDLATDSLRIKPYYYTDSLARDALYERRSSYIYEDKLFQLYLNNEQILFRIRDLGSGKTLFIKSLLRDDTIEGIASSPILVPGRGLLGVEKEYRSVRKFMKRFSKFDPFIQVRRAGGNYLLCAGGFEEVKFLQGVTSAGPGFTTATPTGAWVADGAPSAYATSYERSFSFYSAIDARTMTRSDVYYEKPLIAAYNDVLEKAKKPRDQALYRIGGRFYMGYFEKQRGAYRFLRIENY